MILAIGIIILLSLILFPFKRRIEVFKNNSRTRVEFKGERWSSSQVDEFKNIIRTIPDLIGDSQAKMFTALDDYKRIMVQIEQAAYKKKKGINNVPSGLSKEERDTIMGNMNVSSDPVKDLYDSFDKKKAITMLEESPYKYRKGLPRIAIPKLGPLKDDSFYNWVTMKDSDSKYDKEEEFYSKIPLILPSIMSSVNELLQNAKILRANAGESAWGLRPRVEAMARESEEARKKAEEGFVSKNDTCPDTIKIRVVQTVPYSKWGNMVKDIKSKMDIIQSLVTQSINDINQSETVYNIIKEQGKSDKDIASQTLARS